MCAHPFPFRVSRDFASKVPFMVVPGNHESECHSPACLASRHRLKVSAQSPAAMFYRPNCACLDFDIPCIVFLN